MSHFCVYVITPSEPEDLAAILQPWHEYECTGTEDQYVVDVDVTDQLIERWGEIQEIVRLSDGTIKSRYSQDFYTKDTGKKDYAGRPELEFELPAGATLDTVTQAVLSLAEGQSQEEFAKEYGGWFKKADGRYYDKTNPNKKWDWWQVGGRYTGVLKPGYDADADPTKKETCFICGGTGKRTDMDVKDGCNGCRGTGIRTSWPTQWKAMDMDSIAVKDVPFAELRAVAAQEAAEQYDKVHAIIAGRPVTRWDKTRKKHGESNVDAARKEYHDDPVNKDLAKADVLGFYGTVDDFDMPRADYIKAAEDRAGVPFAFVKDGQWHERGDMGWFGMVSDEKDRDQWNTEFHKMIAELPPESWITVVDAHI